MLGAVAGDPDVGIGGGGTGGKLPLVLYLASEPRRIDGIDVLPWQAGLRAMGL